MFEAGTLVAILLIFLLAGFVKGVVGMGLPTVSLGLLAVFLPLPTAMALVVVPSAVTNFWQAVVGGHGVALLKRFWIFFLSATGFIWIGALVLKTELLIWLPALLGLLLMIHGLLGLTGRGLKLPPKRQSFTGLVFGAINGILTGMTGSFTVPGVLFLQSAELARDRLIQAMGLLFLVSTLGLFFVLYRNGFVTQSLGAQSFLALAPALVGMGLGQKFRHTLSESTFRRVFLLCLVLLGIYLIGMVCLRVLAQA